MEPTPDIIEVKALEQYHIYLKFSNGEEKIYDMSKNIEKIQYFKNVKPRGDTVQWENGEDVAPENLYYDSIPLKEFNN